MNVWETGRQVGPYVLIDRIGAGGMGEVWKARDSRLGRVVALKHLLARSDTFEREARTIAALNHPHICTLHDVGADYLVMEHIDGAPLRGPLDVDEGLRLALQIVAALEAAHSMGIVHRDLKPANVLVSHGHVKLLDFGIATLRRDATSGNITVTTMDVQVAGTPAYMSPEQAQGHDTDARSDIFSFGAVLYEMFSGRRAFEAGSTAETLSAVLRDDPAPPTGVPDGLSRIIARCLKKSPTQRFQSAAELRSALERAAASALSKAPASAAASIAVLPFANLSSDAEQEYFSDGLTEEVINLLARCDSLKVIARTSAFAFKGRNVPVGDIAAALGVTNVLEGSVRRSGSRIRVTAQLVNASDGTHRWSERYDRELADVFAVQDDIASAIVGELRGRLAGRAAARSYTPTVPAYEAYLMARHLVWTKHSPEAYAEAQTLYESAIALDPGYALPHAALAELFHIRASSRGPEARAAAALIRPTAERALTLDPSLPEAHMWLGILTSTYHYDWAAAAPHFAAAMHATPIAPLLRHMNGYFHLRFCGRAQDAVVEHRGALQDDPLNLIINTGLVLSLYSAGRHAEATAEAKRLLAQAPGFAPCYALHVLNVLTEPPSEARAFAERQHTLVPACAGSVGLLAGLLRRDGDADAAAALMRNISSLDVYGNAVDHAFYHLVLGDMDRAFDAMAVLVGQHHPLLTMVLAGGPYGALLRSSSRWPEFARRIGFPQ